MYKQIENLNFNPFIHAVDIIIIRNINIIYVNYFFLYFLSILNNNKAFIYFFYFLNLVNNV